MIPAGRNDKFSNYLDRSREAHILIHGVETRTIQYPRKAETAETDDAHQGSSSSSAGDGGVWTSGKTALHLAACEASSEIVQLLLERGADPNARDLDGRFPLAEAALWGRLESVKILLKYGADKNLECVRAGRRLRAVDFARPLLANQKERYNRAGGRHAVYREIAYERDQDRKAIVCLLQDEMDADPNQRSLHGFAFTSDENLLTLIAKFDVPNKLKTIGVLYRGSWLPTVAAMSGWGHHELDDSNVQISGRTWTNEVRRLCELEGVGHDLPPDEKDQGEPGQFYACHAEKQLIAYFVHKHLFLPFELIQDRSDGEWDDEWHDEWEQEREHKRKLLALADKATKPPLTLKKAAIMVSRSICPDCGLFVERINRALGLEITLLQ